MIADRPNHNKMHLAVAAVDIAAKQSRLAAVRFLFDRGCAPEMIAQILATCTTQQCPTPTHPARELTAIILSNMDKPKLSLAPQPPSLSLDVPQSLTWRDGSALHILPDGGILLYEEKAMYSANRCSTTLSLVAPLNSHVAI